MTTMPEDANTQPVNQEQAPVQVQAVSRLWYRISSVLLPIGTALVLCAAFVYVEDIGGIKSALQRFTSGHTQTEEVSDSSSWALPRDIQPLPIDDEYDEVNQGVGSVIEFPALYEGTEPGYTEYYKNLRTQEGVVWFDVPQPRGELKLVEGWWSNESTEENPTIEYRLQYYAIGQDDGGEIVVTFLPCDGLCFTNMSGLLLFKQVPHTNQYVFLHAFTPSHDTSPDGEDLNLLAFSPEVVQIDETSIYDALIPPEDLDGLLNGVAGEIPQFYFDYDFSANTVLNPSIQELRQTEYRIDFFKDTQYGPLYRVAVDAHGMDEFVLGSTEIVSYLLRLPGGLTTRFTQELSFMGDDNVPPFVWKDGTVNSDAYRADGRSSCGARGAVEVVRSEDVSALKDDLGVVGTITSTGEVVYGVEDPQHWLVRLTFGDVPREVYDSVERGMRTVTPEEFLQNKGVVVYVDEFGQYVVLTNTRFGGGAECGKPVVYLYPESTTDVRVEVGADITVSVPPYEGGWSVVANPDGTLETKEGTFGSLYWDGIGHGEYPDVRMRGALVPRDEVEKVMRDDLFTLGFRSREIDEFIGFWMPHMPDTRFVRLTWLGTQDMNRLAPLTIEPKPDTVIRAFLDFEGFDDPIVLEPQILGVSLPREGFTAVEWGGLLRNPTHSK